MPRPDQGIDALLEGRTNGLPDGRLLALQIKSGESHFRQAVPGGWRFYVDGAHIAYWGGYAIPVLLVLYDPRTERAFWQIVNLDTAQSTGKLFAVDVPRSNVFDSRCGRELDRVAKSLDGQSADGLRNRRVVLDLPWMWMLDDGQRLFLNVEQDLHPATGRCVLMLDAEDRDGDVTTVRTWPWTFLSGGDFGEELAKLFPWADKAIDERRYREYAVADFLVEHGRWVPDEEAYDYATDFDHWFDGRFSSGIAPYGTTADGGKALWRLELTLNDVGRAALEKDEHEMLAEGWAAADAASGKESDRAGGHYTLQVIDHAYSYHGSLDNLVFVYGNEDEDIESLLIEPRLFTPSGDPVPAVAEAILGHARGTRPTESLGRAFSARFAEDFAASDGIWKITVAEIDEWLGELDLIAVHGTDI
jgi:hypothetical protein